MTPVSENPALDDDDDLSIENCVTFDNQSANLFEYKLGTKNNLREDSDFPLKDICLEQGFVNLKF